MRQGTIPQLFQQQKKPSTVVAATSKAHTPLATHKTLRGSGAATHVDEVETPSKRVKRCEDTQDDTDAEMGWSQESNALDDTPLCDVVLGGPPSVHSIDASCTLLDRTIELQFDDGPLENRKMIKDSVHGCIYLEPLCMAIIDTVHFQRLRHLKQLGASYFVYMSATHSRFEHSVGVAHLAELMLSQLRQHQPWLGITDRDTLCVKVAGLCHDLGHGPFSHVFDGIFMQQLKERGLNVPQLHGWTHEQGSLDVFNALLTEHNIDVAQYGLESIDVEFIQELILGRPLPPTSAQSSAAFRGRPAMPFLYQVVNNAKTGLDVDKLDYFMRDARYTGAKASCDTHLLLSTMRVLPDAVTGELTMCWPDKMAEQVMKVFRTRYDLHQAVYQHKATRAIEYMICDILVEADMAGFRIRGARIAEAPLDMNVYKCLDDRILALIESSDDAKLAPSQAILARIANKPLYKWVGTTQATAHSAARSESQIKLEIAAMGNLDPRHLIVEKNRVHFGQKDRDPMQAMRFFRKHATPASTCFQLHEAMYAMHCPKSFMESNVRLFVRDARHSETARQAFATWATRLNRSAVYPQVALQNGVSCGFET